MEPGEKINLTLLKIKVNSLRGLQLILDFIVPTKWVVVPFVVRSCGGGGTEPKEWD